MTLSPRGLLPTVAAALIFAAAFIYVNRYSNNSGNSGQNSQLPSSVCGFLIELERAGDIVQKLEEPSNSGRIGGVQVRLHAAVNVPAGWTVHLNGSTIPVPAQLPAGSLASFWAPDECKPLSIP